MSLLDDERSLSDYNIHDGSWIKLSLLDDMKYNSFKASSDTKLNLNPEVVKKVDIEKKNQTQNEDKCLNLSSKKRNAYDACEDGFSFGGKNIKQ